VEPSLFERPDFLGALTLEERAALPGRPAARPVSGEIARQRLERWRTQPPFEREDFFARRLGLAGLDEEGLLALLAEPREDLAKRLPGAPDWLRELGAAFHGATPGAPLPIPDLLLREPETRLLWMASPVLQEAERRLRAVVAELAAGGRPLPFDPEAIAPLLLAGLADQLLWTVTRAGVLELNVARLEERIAGETPEERFESFIELLRRPGEALRILETYPVLARQITLRVRNWADASIELLRRLAADWDDLLATFGPAGDPGKVVHVRSGAGDRHRGGRTVCLLTFESGWTLVYKPRPMAIAAHFQDLLGWMNERGFEPAFRRIRVLDRGGHGWIEFVTAAPCGTPEEVRRFYQRMGGYLALLYTLDATDFHYENLIAAGEQPVLIDLESIVQPRLPMASRGDSDWLAFEVISRSVLRIGLLPQPAFGGAGLGIDISGLGTPDGQFTPEAHPYWADRGTDSMHLSRAPVKMPSGSHRPSLGGAAVEVTEQVEELVDGFSRAYRILWEHRGELLAEDGLLARMADDEVRVILRPTRTYGVLLQESFHPFLLRDAVERDRHFDNLWRGIAESPSMEKVVAAERRELLAGDIPLFSSRLGSRDLAGVDGLRWPGFFERSGLDLVRGRLAELGEADLGKQIWFIRASLAAHHINLYGGDTIFEPPLGTVAAATADRGRLLEAAAAVGDRLESLALRTADDATWIGLQSRQGRDWRLTPLGGDLYAGLPGVTIFLAYLAESTGDERYRRLARAAWQTLWREREALRGVLTSVGGFDGWGGLLWTLAHLARLWDEPGYLEEAGSILELLPGLIPKDNAFDLVAGSAGCIAGLLALHRTEPSDRALAAAIACGDHLLGQVRRQERGAAWLSSSMLAVAAKPLSGFAHGASGFAWSLLELAAVTGEERFRQAAVDAIEYERSLFVPELGRWQEVRKIESTNVGFREGDELYMVAWCHGAPGVGLSRLRALRHLEDPELRAEAEVALSSTLRQGFDRSHCLCHGDLGNAELLLQAADVLDDGERWRAEAERAGARVLDSVAQHGWRSGLPQGVEVPGLMTGLAGIGYGFLRLAAPDEIPAVLLLDPPVAA
jgi:type 2 lantibiotic biosynthesis protein LanM